jgi:hypothetical protein
LRLLPAVVALATQQATAATENATSALCTVLRQFAGSGQGQCTCVQCAAPHQLAGNRQGQCTCAQCAVPRQLAGNRQQQAGQLARAILHLLYPAEGGDASRGGESAGGRCRLVRTLTSVVRETLDCGSCASDGVCIR